MRLIVFLGVVLSFCSTFFNTASAADPVLISQTIPFANTLSTGFLNQEDCAWNARLVSEMVRQSKGKIAVKEPESTSFAGRQLKIEVVDIYAPSGSMFSGDKWITIRGDLLEEGKRVAGFDFSEKGSSTFGSCRALMSIAGELADDVNEWLKNRLPECYPSCYDRPASDLIRIGNEITYASPEAANDYVLRECDWHKQAVGTLVQLSDGVLMVSGDDLATYNGKKLIIKAVEVHAPGAGGFAGPTWITARGELFDEGKVIGSFHSQQRTIGGSYEACATLRSLGRHLAVEISEWLDNPKMDAKL